MRNLNEKQLLSLYFNYTRYRDKLGSEQSVMSVVDYYKSTKNER